MDEQIEVGDVVYVGDGNIHWGVLSIYPLNAGDQGLDRVATLVSGMTNRMRYEVPLRALRLHSKGKR